ncbi:PAS domain S-box protein [Candidatus Peregrinibacteria bacterium]|nr:PAS domain S-box protein [Candidatus Peregrinibacteria bacterium]
MPNIKKPKASFIFSIKSKLLVIFFLFAIIPIIFIGYSTLSSSVLVLETEISKELKEVGDTRVKELSLLMINSRQSFLGLSNASSFITDIQKFSQDPNDKILEKHIHAELNNFLLKNHVFLEVSFLDAQSGKVIHSTDLSKEGSDEYSNSPAFIQGSNSIYTSKVYYLPKIGIYTITISYPVKSSANKLIGVLSANMDLFEFNKILDSRYLGLNESSEAYLIAPDRNHVTGLGGTSIYKSKDIDAITTFRSLGIDRALNKQSGIETYENYLGYKVVGYFHYLDEFDLALLVESQQSEIQLPLATLVNRIIYIIFSVSIIAILLSFLVAGYISGPIKKLTKITEKISAGAKIKAEINTNDEISELAQSFNVMTGKLVDNLAETKNILNTMPDSLYVLDKNGIINTVNKTSLLSGGYEEDELIGNNFFKFICPYGFDFKNRNKNKLSNLFKKQNRINIEATYVRKDNKKIPVNLSGSIIYDKSKKVEGYIMVVRDLRELKKYAKERISEILPLLNRLSLGDFTREFELPSSEDEFFELIVAIDLMADNLEELLSENKKKTNELEMSEKNLLVSHREIAKEKAKAESLLLNMGEGMLAVDLDGRVIMMNPEAERLFGKKMDFVFVEDCCEFKDKNGKLIMMNSYPISNVIKSKKQIYIKTFFTKKDGSKLPLSTSFSPILLNKKLIGIIVTFRDITKEIQIDKAKSEFVSLASHQLRTPMTGVKWLLQAALMKGKLNPQQKDLIQSALESNDRMMRLVNDLLNVSRLEAGLVGRESQDVDVIEQVNILVKEARFIAMEKKQTIKFIKPKKVIHATFDKQLVGQIINSLLSNAMRYSPKKETITISIKPKKSNFDIIVSDNGIGISKEDQKKLFTKFFRSDEAKKLDTSGSGLGLYIVKKLIGVCNGKLKIKSDVGKGTIVTVTFPYKIQKLKGSKGIIEISG